MIGRGRQGVGDLFEFVWTHHTCSKHTIHLLFTNVSTVAVMTWIRRAAT
jgi:hypothetical protein